MGNINLRKSNRHTVVMQEPELKDEIIEVSSCEPQEITLSQCIVATFIEDEIQRDVQDFVEGTNHLSGVTIGIPTKEEAKEDAKRCGLMTEHWWWTSTACDDGDGGVRTSAANGLPLFWVCNSVENDSREKPMRQALKTTLKNNLVKTKRAEALEELVAAIKKGMWSTNDDIRKDAAKRAAKACSDGHIDGTLALSQAADELGIKRISIPSFHTENDSFESFMQLFSELDEENEDPEAREQWENIHNCLVYWISWMEEEISRTPRRNSNAVSTQTSKEQVRKSDDMVYLVPREFNGGAFVRVRLKGPAIAGCKQRFTILAEKRATSVDALAEQIQKCYGIATPLAKRMAENEEKNDTTLFRDRYVFRKPTEKSDFAIGEFYVGSIGTNLSRNGFKQDSDAFKQVETFVLQKLLRTSGDNEVHYERDDDQEEMKESLFQERYTVTSYYDDDLKGTEDVFSTSDIDEVVDFAWDKYDQGLALKVKNNNTGDTIIIKDGDIDMTDMDAPYIMQDMIMEIKDVITESKKLVVESWNGGYLVRPSKDYKNGIINQKDIRTHYMKSFSNANDVIDFYINSGLAQGKDQFTIK